jgi:hypothetical protein
VIVTEVLDATGEVLIANVAVVLPAATVTLVGTVAAAVLLLDSVTTAPALCAGPVRVTVPVDVFPPRTELGLRATEDNASGVTVSVAVLATP